MSTTAGSAASAVSARARDPNQTGTPVATVIDLLSRMQILVNGATKAVIQSASLVVAKEQQTYVISTSLPNALRIVDIRDSVGRSLDGPVPYRTLKYLNFGWFREMGTELRSWSLVGKDLLIIRPMLPVAQTVTVFYVAVTATLTTGASLFQIPDEDVSFVLDATEFMLNLKARDYDACKPAIERWGKDIEATRTETR